MLITKKVLENIKCPVHHKVMFITKWEEKINQLSIPLSEYIPYRTTICESIKTFSLSCVHGCQFEFSDKNIFESSNIGIIKR